MLGYQVNTKQAVIFKLPPLASTKVENNPSIENIFSCFFDSIDRLVPLTTTSLDWIKKIREKINIKFENYCLCATIFNRLSEMAKKDLILAQKPARKITDPKLDDGLTQNLIRNISDNHIDLSEAVIKRYIYYFIEFYTEKNLGEKKPPEWLSLAGHFINEIWPMLLGEIAQDFFDELNLNEQSLIEMDQQLTGIPVNSLKEKSAIYFSALQQKIAEEYGFKIDSSWEPKKSFDDFMQFIKNYGYIMVGGFFGDYYYDKPASNKQIGALEVFAWEKNTFKSNNNSMGHEIIVIGASRAQYEKTTQNLVYFIDPSLNNNQLFILSYDAFCARISTTNSLNSSVLDKACLNKNTFTYLFYHPKLKPRAQLQNTLWQRFDCQTLTKAAAIGAAIALGTTYALSKNM